MQVQRHVTCVSYKQMNWLLDFVEETRIILLPHISFAIVDKIANLFWGFIYLATKNQVLSKYDKSSSHIFKVWDICVNKTHIFKLWTVKRGLEPIFRRCLWSNKFRVIISLICYYKKIKFNRIKVILYFIITVSFFNQNWTLTFKIVTCTLT